MEGLKVTITSKTLLDKHWGFSDLINGRSIEDNEVIKELIDLFWEDISEIIDGATFEFEIIE